MGETSHVKLWAIIAPLAALAGLAWLHFKRKRQDSLTDDGKTVRHVARKIDPKSSKLPNTNSVHSPDTNQTSAITPSTEEIIQNDIPAESKPEMSSNFTHTDDLETHLELTPTSQDILSEPDSPITHSENIETSTPVDAENIEELPLECAKEPITSHCIEQLESVKPDIQESNNKEQQFDVEKNLEIETLSPPEEIQVSQESPVSEELDVTETFPEKTSEENIFQNIESTPVPTEIPTQFPEDIPIVEECSARSERPDEHFENLETSPPSATENQEVGGSQESPVPKELDPTESATENIPDETVPEATAEENNVQNTESTADKIPVSQCAVPEEVPETENVGGDIQSEEMSPVPDEILAQECPVAEEVDETPKTDSPISEDIGSPEPQISEDSLSPLKSISDNEHISVRQSRADSGFKTMSVEESVSKVEESAEQENLADEFELDEEIPTMESEVGEDECREGNNDSLIFEYEGQESSELPTMSSEELVEIQTAPGRLTTDVSEFEEALASVRPVISEPNSIENLENDQSYDIISASSIVIDETATMEIDTNALSTITEITEDKISGDIKSFVESVQTEPLSGVSGSGVSHLKDAISRTRTESERIQEEDWTNSPIMKLKNTPVLDDVRPTKDKVNGTADHKRPTKMRLNKTSLKSRLEACEDDRDSTTTPDSTKDTSSSQKRAKKPKRKQRERKKKKSETKATGASTATNEESEVKDGTSSDSGTHTDDNVERYMEISGFPSTMIGALIGKKGKNIQNIQTQSNCRILIKDYPVEDGGQYISIEGTRKNINKAISILREKFPDVKISQMEQQTPPESAAQSPEFYPQTYQNGSSMTSEYENAYDYNEMYMGTINTISDQIEIVEGVPVEVRVTSTGPSFNELWVQPYTHPTHDKFCRLEASMSDFYSRDTELSILTNYLDLGSYAMCLHHSPDEHTGKELSKWYRVQIIQYPDDLHVTVLYLDFGGYGSVPIEMLRKIMQEFLPQGSRVPFQAIHAELAGLQWNSKFQPDNNNMTKASVQLHDIIYKAPMNSLEAEVVRYDHYNSRPMVKLAYNVSNTKIVINQIYGESVKMLDYQPV